MGLKAHVRTDSIGNITVHMRGGLGYETSSPLKNQLIQLTTDNPTSTITIDLASLDFVGSSGIGHFVDTINSLNNNKSQIRLANVRSEFLKVFKLYKNGDALEALIDQFDDDETALLSQNFAGRKNTFQN